MIDEAALGEFQMMIFMRWVPFLTGGVLGLALIFFFIYMFEHLLIEYRKGKRNDRLSQPVDGQRPQE